MYTRVWLGVYACVCGVVLVLVFLFVRSLSARRAWEFRDSTGPPGGRARAFCLLLVKSVRDPPTLTYANNT